MTQSMQISYQTAKKVFWGFALTHLVLWTILPWLVQPSPATTDVLESFILAREWVMGSTKHPPLPWWFLEIVYQLTGQAGFASYLASQCWVLLGLWAVWRLSREYTSELIALIVVFSAAAYRYFNLGSLSYTTSVPPVSLWCFVICILALAFQYNRKRDWCLAGVGLGVGLLCKYSLGILVLTIILYMLLSPYARRYVKVGFQNSFPNSYPFYKYLILWRMRARRPRSQEVLRTDLKTSGPWLMGGIAFLVFLPHLIWVIQHDFITIRSAGNSITDVSRWTNHLVSPIKFGVSQIFLFLPILIGLIPLLGFAWQLRWIPYQREKQQIHSLTTWDKNTKRNYLTFMIAVPLFMHLAIGAVFGANMRPAYGSPLWPLIGLWFVVNFQATCYPVKIKATILLCAATLGVIVSCYILNYQFYYWKNPDKPSKIHFPGNGLGKAVSAKWRSHYNCPCPYLGGDWKLAGQAAFNMKERPSVLCYYDGLNPGQKPVGFYAFDKDLNEKGGILLWAQEANNDISYVPDWLELRYPTAVVSPEIIVLPYQTKATVSPLRVRYAIVPREK